MTRIIRNIGVIRLIRPIRLIGRNSDAIDCLSISLSERHFRYFRHYERVLLIQGLLELIRDHVLEYGSY